MGIDNTLNFNGSILNFNEAAVGEILSITFHVGGEKVNVASAADLRELFEMGLDNVDVSAEVLGPAAGHERKDTGNLSVDWNDGTTDTVADQTFVINDRETSGSKNQPITTKFQFCCKGPSTGS